MPPPRDDMVKYVAYALAKGPKIGLRIGWRFLKVKKRAQRAERIFRKRLISAGVDRETANLLAEKYSSTVRIREMLRAIGVPGSVFKGNGK